MTSPPTRHIDQYSVGPIPIEIFFDNNKLGIGTGFVWKRGTKFFIITNYHNVSGKDPFSGKHISPKLAEPNNIICWFHAKNYSLGDRYRQRINLYDAESQCIWLTHPVLKTTCDIVAIEIIDLKNIDPHPINEFSQTALSIGVGRDLFILGYPFDITPDTFPIWKRASVASEPAMVGAQKPYMFVDSASRPGMSGSPVVARSVGTAQLEDGNTIVTTGTATRLFGIYSGRLHTNDPMDAQLGLVWPINLIEEILSQ